MRIGERTFRVLSELAVERDESPGELLDRLIEAERRRVLLRRTNEAYAALRADPAAWVDYRAEVAAWDATVGDGLEEASLPEAGDDPAGGNESEAPWQGRSGGCGTGWGGRSP